LHSEFVLEALSSLREHIQQQFPESDKTQ